MSDSLGKIYQPGQDIVTEGEPGECMFLILDGEADILKTVNGVTTKVDSIGKDDIFGEIAIVERIAPSCRRSCTSAILMLHTRSTTTAITTHAPPTLQQHPKSARQLFQLQLIGLAEYLPTATGAHL